MRTRLYFAVLLSLCLCSVAGVLAQVSPSPTEPLFRERAFGPRPEETPRPYDSAPEATPGKPIPRSWKIGGAAGSALLAAGLLLYAKRRWRMWNLFDREYRFPIAADVPLRLGGSKCGGHIATVRFTEADSPSVDRSAET